MAALWAMQAEDGSGYGTQESELTWWLSETLARIESMRRIVQTLAPWLLPEYRNLRLADPRQKITLNSLPSIVPDLEQEISVTHSGRGVVVTGHT